ncbi:MAG: hypothetical protein MUE59_04125 [Thiobacillaceae bacterium]|jgi:hypothetical protein|nr:hypothetical protein [Thiobacillaceae bacterium]
MMQLLPLTAAEEEFLARGPLASILPPERLTRSLAAWLSARLRLPLQVQGFAIPLPCSVADVPQWRRDPLLDTLWLTCRLGGRQVRGAAAPEQPGLTRTLNQLLAETWLDTGHVFELPLTLGWQIGWPGQSATLELDLPGERRRMKRWALEVIRDID